MPLLDRLLYNFGQLFTEGEITFHTFIISFTKRENNETFFDDKNVKSRLSTCNLRNKTTLTSCLVFYWRCRHNGNLLKGFKNIIFTCNGNIKI